MLNTYQLHQNDREVIARNLGLSLDAFDKLVESANNAYEVIKALGPFYGREDIKDPTFRITAEPVSLPSGARQQLTQFGNDFYALAKILHKLPESHSVSLGDGLDFKIPATWRIDAILDENGLIKVNEIEGVDSASALIIAEQQAYNLQPIEESTAAHIIPTLKSMCSKHEGKECRLALIRVNVAINPHTPNALRFINFLQDLSKGELKVDLLDENEINTGQIKPDWNIYCGVINETPISPKGLKRLGIRETQIFSAGNYNVLGNKGIFALLFDESLDGFWEEGIGVDRLLRLRKLLIKSSFIKSLAELKKAKIEGKVVKVSWAGNNMTLINRSKGVAIPEGLLEQSSEERWKDLEDLLKQEVKIIAQDYVRPARIKAYLRKKGTNLEPVEWYNRVCVKYVCKGHPNLKASSPEIALTGVEVTLGPDIIPAGRKCAFTAGKFVD